MNCDRCDTFITSKKKDNLYSAMLSLEGLEIYLCPACMEGYENLVENGYKDVLEKGRKDAIRFLLGRD